MNGKNLNSFPDEKGFFGEHGGQFIPEHLVKIMNEIRDSYLQIRETRKFRDELDKLNKYYVGRPSPIYHAQRLSEKYGGAQIYLKREDLNHTGAHKINHCLGEALLAKFMGKKKSSPKPEPASMAWRWPRPAL
ncbi:MAG: hypothetical protein PHV59_11185 [Victivallales bacterium]|nr:hypothetical protein [Victivallales bacterium]